MSPAPSTILLIRHAHTDDVGRRLAGRSDAVPLSAVGRAQADALAHALQAVPLAAIYTSPRARAAETARALARYQAAPLHVHEAFDEIDFGDWTGRTFDELAPLPEWQAFNHARSTASVPHGERPADVQRRVVAALEELALLHAGQVVAVVSHADVLRSAVLHVARTPLDLYDRFEISPASVTSLVYSDAGPRLLYVNNMTYATGASARP